MMTSLLDYIEALRPQDQDYLALLDEIPQDDPFWGVGYYVLNPNHPVWFQFGFADPPEFSDTPVNAEVFVKILDAMVQGKLGQDDMATALGRFSRACTQREWEHLYKPVLQRQFVFPVNPQLFNRFAPERWQVPAPKLKKLWSFDPKETKFPKRFLIEPYNADSEHYSWFATQDEILCANVKTGEPHQDDTIRWFLEQVVSAGSGLPRPVHLDAFLEPDTGIWTLRDIYMEGDAIPPLRDRLELLEGVCAQILHSEHRQTIQPLQPVESSLEDADTNRLEFSLAIEGGHHGIIIRDANAVTEPHAGLAIHPTVTSNLTVVDVICEDDRVKYLLGEGKIGRKKFQTEVAHGLTNTEKEQLYKDTDALKGRQFKVVSCGLGSSGKLSFPVFKNWKD